MHQNCNAVSRLLICLFSHLYFLHQYCQFFGCVWYLVANAAVPCPDVGFHVHCAYFTLSSVSAVVLVQFFVGQAA